MYNTIEYSSDYIKITRALSLAQYFGEKSFTL